MNKLIVATLAAGLSLVSLSQAQTSPTSNAASKPAITMDDAHKAAAQKLSADGVKFLLSQRNPDGSWSIGPDKVYVPAMTGLVLKTLIGQQGLAPENKELADAIDKGFDVMLKFRQKDGGIYEPKEGQAAYTTAIVVTALAAAKTPKYNETLADAVKYLKGLQIAPGQESPDGKVVAADDPRVGGVGYGKPPAFQPNLSVMGFVMDAWEEANVPKDDPAVKNALDFLTRLQNRSESNTMAFAKEGDNDGGFVYSLTESKASVAGKGLRSYGSMTYVGFKSMLYAGVGKDDPRIKAAYNWIRKYWGLDSNPNLPDQQSQQGLYYYYHVFAKALRVWGQPVIADLKGKDHNWREELTDALKQRVNADGSWSNKADRWEEGSPLLVTSYCLMALQEVLK